MRSDAARFDEHARLVLHEPRVSVQYGGPHLALDMFGAFVPIDTRALPGEARLIRRVLFVLWRSADPATGDVFEHLGERRRRQLGASLPQRLARIAR